MGGGFSSFAQTFFAAVAAHSERADESKDDLQVPEMQRAIRSRPPKSQDAMLLRESGMPEGIESREPEAMVGEAGEQKLLSWGGKYGSFAAVAEGKSRVSAQKEACREKSATRSLRHSRCWGR